MLVDVFGRERSDVFFEHMAEVILIIKAAFRSDLCDGVKVSEVDKILGTLDAVDIQVILKGLIKAFFKETAKMLGTVLTVCGNIGGGDILVEVILDVCADVGHKFEHIRGISVLLAVQVIAHGNGVKPHQFGKGFHRPTVVFGFKKRGDTVDALEKRGACGMRYGNSVFEVDALEIGKKTVVSALRGKDVIGVKHHTDARKRRIRVGKIGSVRLKGIDDNNVALFDGEGAVIDHDLCASLKNTEDFHALVIVIARIDEFGVEDFGYRL